MEKMVLGKFSVLASAERNPKFRAKATNEDHGRSKTKITMPLVTLKNMGGGEGRVRDVIRYSDDCWTTSNKPRDGRQPGGPDSSRKF
ncbi:hypothetical protein V3C99_007946 [Haemonchus contortus]